MNVWNLKPGTVIRIVKTFRDCYGSEFAAGRILHFTHRNYLPYHAGHTVYFQEATIYLCDNDETSAIVQNHNDEYFVVTALPDSEETARQQQSLEEERLRLTSAARKREQYKVLLAMLAVAIAFCVAIPLGFWLRTRYPKLPDSTFAAIVVAMLFAIALGLMRLLLRPFWRGKQRVSLSAMRREAATDPSPEGSGNGSAQRTGYEISLEDLRRLVSDPYCQPVSAPLLQDWYGYKIEGQGPNAAVRSHEGEVVDLRDLHQRIQNDPVKQRAIYNRAMDLWR